MRLKVEEVARNKTMKDMWPLRGANKGDIQLTLAFQPIMFDDDMEDQEEVSNHRNKYPQVGHSAKEGIFSEHTGPIHKYFLHNQRQVCDQEHP